jgi:hypothetical protein
MPWYSSQCWMYKDLEREGLLLSVARFCLFLLFPRTGILSLLQWHELFSLAYHMWWPESRRVTVPCCWLNDVPICPLCDGTVCFVQRLGTILTGGGAVRASLPIAIQHSHLVLGSQGPISMLSTILAAVELAMPRKTSFLLCAFPSAPNQ